MRQTGKSYARPVFQEDIYQEDFTIKKKSP